MEDLNSDPVSTPSDDGTLDHLDLSPDPIKTDSTRKEIPDDEVAPVDPDNSKPVDPAPVNKPDELPKGIQKRFSKMSEQKRAMQAEIDGLKAQIGKANPEPELDRDDYTDDEWMDILVDKKLNERSAKTTADHASARAQADSVQASQDSWNSKVNSFKEDYPDFQQKVAALDVEFPADVLQEISQSKVGPRMAYHLADNEDEAMHLLTMSENGRRKYLWNLENQMKAVSPKQKLTNASPTPSSKGRGGKVSESSMSMDDWMTARRKKLYGN